jgi:hypothetical protein
LRSWARAEIEPSPVGVVKHQLDVGSLGDDLADPAVVAVIVEDLGVEGLGLIVGDPVEVYAVKVAEGGELIAVEAGGARVVEVVFGASPPGVERFCGLPDVQCADLRVIAASPEAVQGHPSAAIGLHQAGEAIERPEVVVGVDRGHGVDPGFDPAISVGTNDGLTERVCDASGHEPGDDKPLLQVHDELTQMR